MITFNGINGKTAKVMLDQIDETTAKQIQSIIIHPILKSSCVIMPDCHAGKGCVIGYTAALENDLIPNLVGVDIACGVNVVKFDFCENKKFNFEQFDRYVKQNIPLGFSTNDYNVLKEMTNEKPFIDLCKRVTNSIQEADRLYMRAASSVGTLGGGNHAAELDQDKNGNIWAMIHSGSRNLGKVVAEYYQNKAVEFCKQTGVKVCAEQAYLPIEYGGDDYIEAMKLCQLYASLNRKKMIDVISKFFKREYSSHVVETIESVHNYINFSDNIIRKGAVSAHKGEKLIIPLNMRDGVIIAMGKGNPEWNFSAPHGAGRILSRGQAKRQIILSDFKKTMEGIYSSTVTQDTLDESPFAYKDSQMIIDAIGDTVEVVEVIKPIYNIKSSGE